jgi:hypothetical protein
MCSDYRRCLFIPLLLYIVKIGKTRRLSLNGLPTIKDIVSHAVHFVNCLYNYLKLLTIILA